MKAINIIDDLQKNDQDLEKYKDYFKHLDKASRKSFWIESFSIDNILLKEDLFLDYPEIWVNFDKQDWVDVLRKNSPRPLILETSDSKIWDINNFKDLIVLNKYLKINPFYLLFENKSSFLTEDIKSCFNYGILLSGLFYEPEEYIKELLEDTNLKYSNLIEISNNLKFQGCQERLSDPESLKNWLKEKLSIM
ncbi:hypothetical protein ACP3T3_15650 [Chryseobacterium sp. CBSDS_008]|uniref:hypothetical protein n=1 Tax=Chryseobacterium sp. CBSDS_008 TaxID=3415265 RepID=UPI003CE9537D